VKQPNHQRTLASQRLLALGLAALGIGTGMAGQVRTSIGVSATVLAVAHIERQSEPKDLAISAADLERGYIDVSEPTAVVIHSNSALGFALEVLPVVPIAASMIVRGCDAQASLGAEGGTIVQRWQHTNTMRLSLHFRLLLAPGLAPGRYPWPVQLSVRPLESI
jgi:hypothetical protein